MPRDSSGNYALPNGTIVNTGDTVLPSQHNPAMQDIAQGLTNSLARTGAGPMLAALDMGNNAISNIGSASISGALSVAGAISTTTSLGVTGNAGITGTLGVGSNASVSGALTIAGQTTSGGSLLLSGPGPTITFNTASARIFSSSANTISIGVNATTESLAIRSVGNVNIHGQRGTSGDIPGSGNLRVIAAAPGAIGINTYDTIDYTAIQFVRDVGGSPTQEGAIVVGTTGTSYNTTSDERLKDNFRLFDSGAILDRIKVGQFDWRDGGTGYGVLAQQAYDVFPQAIIPGVDGSLWQADYSKYVPVLMAEVKTLRERVANLEIAASNVLSGVKA